MSLSLNTDSAQGQPAHTAAFHPPAFGHSPVARAIERPDEGVFVLPGGYVDDEGVAHTEVEMEPLTGQDEEWLAGAHANGSTASVVTRLLSRCLKRLGAIRAISPQLARQLLVGDRDFLMLKLRSISFGPNVLAVQRCPNPACGAPMDVTFSLDEIPSERKAIAARSFTLQLSAAAVVLSDDEGREHRDERHEHSLVEFRLPTGADQEDLAALFHADETQACDQLLARCLKRVGAQGSCDAELVARLSPLARSEIEAEMERLSPQVLIVLDGVCPECQLPLETPFDLTAFFVAELRLNARQLERDVHTLARHYHWSERDILALTCKKRRRYIHLLQTEMEQSEQL